MSSLQGLSLQENSHSHSYSPLVAASRGRGRVHVTLAATVPLHTEDSSSNSYPSSALPYQATSSSAGSNTQYLVQSTSSQLIPNTLSESEQQGGQQHPVVFNDCIYVPYNPGGDEGRGAEDGSGEYLQLELVLKYTPETTSREDANAGGLSSSPPSAASGATQGDMESEGEVTLDSQPPLGLKPS